MLLIGAVLLGTFVADRAWIRGNGIVSGQLTAVSPIVQARLQKLEVNCLERVMRGQRVAEFVNEEMMEAASQQMQQLQLELVQARAGIDIADHEAKAASKLVEAQAALLKQQTAILAAEDDLVKQHFVAALVWDQAKAAVDHADADTRAAEFVYQTKRADQRRAELDADVLQKRIDSFRDSPELTGHFYLSAPTDGIVTECTAQTGEVIAARTPIFRIFNPEAIFAVVFFDPDAMPKLNRGRTFRVSVGGLDEPVTAMVTGFYPELSALPSSLTRYFWQEEKWSQYVPVRLDFINLSEAQRSKIFAWAQVSASSPPNLPSWHWVQQSVIETWHMMLAIIERQPNNQ